MAPATAQAIRQMIAQFDFKSYRKKRVSHTTQIKVGSLEWFYRESSPIGRTDLVPVCCMVYPRRVIAGKIMPALA